MSYQLLFEIKQSKEALNIRVLKQLSAHCLALMDVCRLKSSGFVLTPSCEVSHHFDPLFLLSVDHIVKSLGLLVRTQQSDSGGSELCQNVKESKKKNRCLKGFSVCVCVCLHTVLVTDIQS